jgi:hypothetical protein
MRRALFCNQRLIYTTYSGVLDLGEDGYQKFLKQELPKYIQLRIAPRYHTAHPEYQWLNSFY